MNVINFSYNVKRFIYFFLIACIALSALHFFKDRQINWFVWTMFALSLESEATFWQGERRIIITGLLLAISVGLVGYLSSHPYFLSIYFFLVTVFCMLGCQLSSRYYFSFFIINLFTLFAGAFPPVEAENITRLLMMLAGLAVVLLLYMPLAWRFNRDVVQKTLVVVFRDLKELCEEIFSCLLQADYADNIYLYERRLHLQKNSVMASLDQLSKSLSFENTPEKKQVFDNLFSQLKMLYAILLDCSQLRWRITDYKTLGLCSGELLGVMLEMKAIFANCMQACVRSPLSIDNTALEQRIYQLEENYQHILRVAAHEPLIFLLFIDSLKAFAKETQILSETVDACLSSLT